MRIVSATVAIVASLGLQACASVPFDAPEIALPAEYSGGANVKFNGFEGNAGWAIPTQDEAMTTLMDQVRYGLIRCSRPGRPLDVNLHAKFETRARIGPGRHHLVGAVEWREPSTGRLVGRHQIDLPVDLDNDDWERTNQLEAGERMIAGLCEQAFGWSGFDG